MPYGRDPLYRERERERKKNWAEREDGCDVGKGSVNYSYRLRG